MLCIGYAKSVPDEGLGLSTDRNPSPVSHLAMRAILSHKGRGEVSVAPRARSHPACFVISPPHPSRAMLSCARIKTRHQRPLAFSSEVGTGSREENASK